MRLCRRPLAGARIYADEGTRAGSPRTATGKPIGALTWLISIESGNIVDRRRAGEDDNCDSESYQPI
jgi:hypothetical protein